MPRKSSKGSPEEQAAGLLATLCESEDGVHSIIYGNEENDLIVPKYYYSTGVPPVDGLIGNKGFASGKLTEVYGPNRTCKSELVQSLTAQFLSDFKHGLVIYYDQECAIDHLKLEARPQFLDKRCMISIAENAEAWFADLEKKLKAIHEFNTETPILIVVDSLAAMETKMEQDAEIGKAHYAPLARILSSGLKRLKFILSKTNAHLIIVNQIRKDVSGNMFAEDESPGGQALKFYADYRIKTSFKGNYYFKAITGKDKGYPDGLKIGFKTVKNKMVPPLREIEIPVVFNKGNWGGSGLNPAWAVYHTLHKGNYIKAAGPTNYIVNFKDAGTFAKVDWPEVWLDPSHKLQEPVQIALRDWEAKLFGNTSLGFFPDIEIEQPKEEEVLPEDQEVA